MTLSTQSATQDISVLQEQPSPQQQLSPKLLFNDPLSSLLSSGQGPQHAPAPPPATRSSPRKQLAKRPQQPAIRRPKRASLGLLVADDSKAVAISDLGLQQVCTSTLLLRPPFSLF